MNYQREINLKYDVDVFVAGGGPAGIAAAVTAARMGRKVFCAEKAQCFGGMATLALVPAFMRFSDGENFLAGGIGREIFDKLYGEDSDFTLKEIPIDTEKLKLVYDNIMIESGVQFAFDTEVIDAETENGEIKYLIIRSGEELCGAKAKVYIDATGNGTLAVKAGAPYEMGDENGLMMPATLCTTWSGIDWSRAEFKAGKDPDARMLPKAFEDGVFSVKDPKLSGMWPFENDRGGGNIGHAFGVDGTDAESVTEGILDARRRMGEYQYYYNNYLPGYENARLTSTANVLGIRESRRITGEEYLTSDAYFEHAVFDNEIGRYAYPIDMHLSKIGVKEKFEGIFEKDYEKGKSYGIPFGCLIPKNTVNLLMAGRCISGDREIIGSLRVMPGCFITGMAAGAAAAMSAMEGKSVRKLDIKKLQKKLKDMGAYLPNTK